MRQNIENKENIDFINFGKMYLKYIWTKHSQNPNTN